MSLEFYRRKRDFSRTREPMPARARTRASGRARELSFVVQEHHASHLHYDFRLEAGGVLKSWAVPKTPALDPAVKRLAVEVEDHPLDYASFEGVIPQGEYGGGTVSIWDQGTYAPVGEASSGLSPSERVERMIERGHVEFELHGRKLKGRFALIRPGSGSRLGRGSRGQKTNWLLIKLRDSATRTEFKNLDKVMYPDAGYTKRDVLEYYRKIAPKLLPYLANRPMTLERWPDGVHEGAPHFWQKNTPAYYPKWIPRVALPSQAGKRVEYVLVNDVETLLYLVNQGALCFHPYLSRVDDLGRPDFVLFDLDPGHASFATVVELAHELRAVLKAHGVPAFVKTSGKSGLHVLTPWTQKGGYDKARSWAFEVAGELVERKPKIATTERVIAKRGRRVYIDVIQNAEGHHVVPPYVLRAVPEASVSMPLDWAVLTPKLSPHRFTLKQVLQAQGKRGASDAFAGLLLGKGRKSPPRAKLR